MPSPSAKRRASRRKFRQADSLSSEDLATASVVILNDTPIAQTTAERLQAFVQRGGGLFIVAGERASWPSVADILPGVPGPAVDRSRGAAARLGALEYGHPLFEVFRGPRTGDFASARFYGYRSVTPGPNIIAGFSAMHYLSELLQRVMAWILPVAERLGLPGLAIIVFPRFVRPLAAQRR